MSKRLMTQFEPLVEEAVEKHRQGENITWEVGFGIHPQTGPCWFLGLFLPNPAEIGEFINFIAVLGPAPKVMGAEIVDRAVVDAIAQLLKMRTEALKTPQGAPGTNGGGTPPQGLHGLPGGP
jgi:hypothetical protein